MNGAFSEITVKSVWVKMGGRIWRWLYTLRRALARPFKKLRRRIHKIAHRSALYVTDCR